MNTAIKLTEATPPSTAQTKPTERSHFDQSLRTLLFRSLSWTSAARGAGTIRVVLRYVIFARMLKPFDFGVVRAANLCLILATALTNPNCESSLVPMKEEITSYLDTVWLTIVMQGVVVGLALFLFAGPLSLFFRIPHAYKVFWAVGPLALAKGLRSPGSGSRIYRKMDFQIVFVLTAVEQLAGLGFGLFAIFWFGDWRGLIGAMYAETLGRNAITYWYFPYRPRLEFDSTRFRKMFAYGRWVTIRGLANYVSHNLDNLVVGHLLGAKALGEYQMAFRLGEVSGTEVGGIAGLVSLPLVSRIGNEHSQRWRLFVWTSGAVAVVGVVYALLLLRFGSFLITKTVGEKWLGAVPALRLLCFYGVAQGLVIVAIHFLDGLNLPDVSFRISLISTVTLALLVYPLTSAFGSVGAAAAVVTSVLIPMPIMFQFCWSYTSKTA